MTWKAGDRAVTKGIEVEIVSAKYGLIYCDRVDCGADIHKGELCGHLIMKSRFHQDIFVCLDCLQPADREEKVKALIEAAKDFVNNYNLRLSALLKDKVINALHELGEDA